jgi:predicted XRE-type DNA-binding protein
MIHRLVAEHFISNPENKTQVHHIDNDVTNNKIENLEWATPSENVKYTLGYRKETRGVDNNKSKLSEEDVLKIRKMYGENNITQRELAKLFNVSQPNIKEIVKFRTWKHL